MKKDKKKQIKELLHKLQQDEFCPKGCYGCYGDGKIDITCNIVVDNFEKELLKHYRKISENEVVISKEEKQKLFKEMYEQGRFDAIADLEKDYKVVISKGTLERLFTEEEVEKLKEYARNQAVKEFAEKFHDNANKESLAWEYAVGFERAIKIFDETLKEVIGEKG